MTAGATAWFSAFRHPLTPFYEASFVKLRVGGLVVSFELMSFLPLTALLHVELDRRAGRSWSSAATPGGFLIVTGDERVAGTTFYPCRHRAEHHILHSPFGDRDGSPRRAPNLIRGLRQGPGDITSCSHPDACSPDRSPLHHHCLCLQPRPFGQHVLVHPAPQGNQQPARQRDDSDLA